jgi:hypothetical protein
MLTMKKRGAFYFIFLAEWRHHATFEDKCYSTEDIRIYYMQIGYVPLYMMHLIFMFKVDMVSGNSILENGG